MVLVKLVPKYSLDILLTTIIILICLGIFFYAKRTNYKILLKVLSIYIFVNFLIFPFLYLITIKFDSNSFKIENDISKNEKRNSITELKSQYEPVDLVKSIDVIKELELENSVKLENHVSFLNDGGIIVTQSFLLSKDCIPIRAHRPMYKGIIKICNKQGLELASILDEHEGCELSGHNQTIRTYLYTKKQDLVVRLKDYSNEERNITTKDDFWSYHQIITYSANVFSTSNLVPISRMANIIYYLHFFIGNGILLTILIAFIQKTLEKTKET